MLLATHPEIQEKVADELKEVFYSDEVEVSYDNIMKLDLLERVIKESLRLCPVVPIIGRETQANLQLGMLCANSMKKCNISKLMVSLYHDR